tara:strand:+ start:142 stop:300 length:159 start_codon:yes stop_codon:yes gene_type:complete
MTDKDYHEGYFEGIRAALFSYIQLQEEGINNSFHKWLNNEIKEAKQILRDNK